MPRRGKLNQSVSSSVNPPEASCSTSDAVVSCYAGPSGSRRVLVAKRGGALRNSTRSLVDGRDLGGFVVGGGCGGPPIGGGGPLLGGDGVWGRSLCD